MVRAGLTATLMLAGSLVFGGAQAQAPAVPPPALPGAATAPPVPAPTSPVAPPPATPAQPAPPRTAAPQRAAPARPAARQLLRARPYAQCNARARQIGLRGAERRRFVARCQLGYEGQHFRGR